MGSGGEEVQAVPQVHRQMRPGGQSPGSEGQARVPHQGFRRVLRDAVHGQGHRHAPLRGGGVRDRGRQDADRGGGVQVPERRTNIQDAGVSGGFVPPGDAGDLRTSRTVVHADTLGEPGLDVRPAHGAVRAPLPGRWRDSRGIFGAGRADDRPRYRGDGAQHHLQAPQHPPRQDAGLPDAGGHEPVPFHHPVRCGRGLRGAVSRPFGGRRSLRRPGGVLPRHEEMGRGDHRGRDVIRVPGVAPPGHRIGGGEEAPDRRVQDAQQDVRDLHVQRDSLQGRGEEMLHRRYRGPRHHPAQREAQERRDADVLLGPGPFREGRVGDGMGSRCGRSHRGEVQPHRPPAVVHLRAFGGWAHRPRQEAEGGVGDGGQVRQDGAHHQHVPPLERDRGDLEEARRRGLLHAHLQDGPGGEFGDLSVPGECLRVSLRGGPGHAPAERPGPPSENIAVRQEAGSDRRHQRTLEGEGGRFRGGVDPEQHEPLPEGDIRGHRGPGPDGCAAPRMDAMRSVRRPSAHQ